MPRRTLVRIFPRPLALALCLVAVTLILGACSKGGGGSIQVKSPATGDKDLVVKSGYAFAVTKSFTDTSNNITTAAAYNVYVASSDLDGANFAMTLNKPLTADDQLRVEFSLIGEQGTNDKAPLKAGTYSAKADRFMKLETVGIISRKGGADNKVWLERGTLTGEAKVTSVSGDTISGDVDLSSGTTSIKGPFTAKILVRK